MSIKRTVIVSLVLLVIASSGCFAQQSKYYALFITKMTESVKWPDESADKVIGVVGNSGVKEYLQGFADMKSTITIVDVKSVEDLKKCQVLFVPNSSVGKAKELLSTIGNSSILVISDDQKMTGSGADIGLFIQDGKLNFLISQATLQAKNLTISSALASKGQSI